MGSEEVTVVDVGEMSVGSRFLFAWVPLADKGLRSGGRMLQFASGLLALELQLNRRQLSQKVAEKL